MTLAISETGPTQGAKLDPPAVARSPLARRVMSAIVLASMAGGGVAVALQPLPAALAGDAPRLATGALDLVMVLRVGWGMLIAGLAGLAIGVPLASRSVLPLGEVADAVEAGRMQRIGPSAAMPPVLARLALRDDEVGRIARGVGALLSAGQDRAADKEDFAAELAHELRNPLASMRSAAAALKRADEARRQELLDLVDHDVHRIDRLVAEMTRTSRLDAELVREIAAPLDLVAMVGAIVEHLAITAAEAGVEVVADLPEEPLEILGLDARLAQVVVNLVENAVSLCDQGDVVHVRVRRRGDRALLAVEDTGPGIPDGAFERIFRRFYTRRPAEQFGRNSGLGLTIARTIVEAHGGVIWAENIRPTESDFLSEPLGARFVAALPL